MYIYTYTHTHTHIYIYIYIWRRTWQPTPVFLPRESPWTEEPDGLQSRGSQRVGHDWAAKHMHTYTHIHIQHTYIYMDIHIQLFIYSNSYKSLQGICIIVISVLQMWKLGTKRLNNLPRFHSFKWLHQV